MTLKRKILLMFTIFVLLTLTWSWIIFRELTMEQITTQNEWDLGSFAVILGRRLESNGLESIKDLVKPLDELRLTLVGPSGNVLFDSEEDARRMDNHLNRPEIKTAFTSANGEGSSLRYSDTLKTWYNYYALLLNNGDVIRVASPIKKIDRIFSQSMGRFFIWITPAFLMLSFLWLWLTKRLFMPIESLIESAGNMNLNENSTQPLKFPLKGDPEIQRLGYALNEMGERLISALIDIRRRREELSQIVEALPVGVVLTDSFHKIRYVNTVAKTLFFFFSSVTKGCIVDRMLPNREIINMLDSDDQSKDFYLPLNNMYVNIGSLSVSGGKLLVVRDLTNEKNIEEMRRNFIIDAGHEFQTPLTVIRMAAELLLSEEIKISVVGKNNLENIIRQQERLTELVDELLLLTKTDNPSTQDNTEEINISELILGITGEIKTNPSADNTKIEVTISEEYALVTGRKLELERALSNVIENAVKYSQDVANPHVRISLNREDVNGYSYFKITVEDNGPGISDGKAIFEPFRRGDSARSRKGSKNKGGYGLGLSITKRVIESLGGKISIEKTDLGGASFVILLRN
jgi:two-component system phosphate regulon sensor histidine kinase PhoR